MRNLKIKTEFTSRHMVISAFTAVMLMIGLEIVLRKVWGLGTMLLFKEDDTFEYIAQPNQNLRRFGNRIIYNEYSMRSKPLSSDDSCIILGMGDSVINGGVLTDHDSLATTLVENQLGNGYRFLNVSSGSWGPDNCAGYLKKYGHFYARLIILMVNSDDSHDVMTFEKIVGRSKDYPERQYSSAIGELVLRYLKGAAANLTQSFDTISLSKKSSAGFNPGFSFITNYVNEHNIPFLLCLHAEAVEIRNNKFSSEGEEILNYCKSNNIRVISGLEIGENLSHLRDETHLNEKGQKLWAKVLFNEIKNTVKPCP